VAQEEAPGVKAFKWKMSPARKPQIEERSLRFNQLVKCLKKYDIIDQVTDVRKGKRRLINTETGQWYPINWVRKDAQEIDRETIAAIRRCFGLIPPKVECADFFK
jgi:hypothetical protein